MEKVKLPSGRFIRFLKNKYIRGTLLVMAGFLSGAILLNHPAKNERSDQAAGHDHSDAEITIWTCAMHPTIRMEKPGQCPICGMDLIPLKKSDAVIDDNAVVISESAMKLAEVQTSVVRRGAATKEVFLYGKIRPDEKLLRSQTAHIPGRIEKLYVNVTGEQVREGQLIARIYSPELVTAQRELIEAIAISDKYPEVIEAAREKLRNWKLTDRQIRDIETSSSITSAFDIYSNTTGIVSSRKVNEGDYISKGAVLFDVIDLSEVWAVFDAYESDLPWISPGQKVEFTTRAIPGKSFNGKISFIDPVIDPVKRTAGIRMEINNPGFQLKPDMFINGIIKSVERDNEQRLLIPQSAVLWTGPRSIVYVKIPGTEFPAFKMTEITLGAAMEDSYIVLAGLKEGEEIVTNGTFSVDASAQLEGKPSMMNIAEITRKTALNNDFAMQLNKVYDQYIIMKNAFVKSNEKEVEKAAQSLQQKINGVDKKLLSGDALARWISIVRILDQQVKIMATGSGLEIKRAAFSTFNNSFYQAVREFSLSGRTVYYQFCPMANEDNGAYWLSETKDIRNPYFGDAMLTCGETKETLNY